MKNIGVIVGNIKIGRGKSRPIYFGLYYSGVDKNITKSICLKN